MIKWVAGASGRIPRIAGSLLAGLVLTAPCSAESGLAQEAHDALEDTVRYFAAPLHWNEGNWFQFGASVAAIAAAHEFDDNVRNHFVSSSTVLDGKDPHSSRDAIPVAAMLVGTWAFAALLQDRDGFEEGRTMLESGALAALSTSIFKFAAGRRRPNETTQVDDWRQSGSSFPSLHVSAAFAIGTVLAESGNDEYRWARRGIGYGLALATGYARLHDNAHWLSDTVAGAALGIATAQFTMNRNDDRRRQVSLNVVPTDGGAILMISGQPY
ncbi:MAG: phosphatase PAP2 family protein [Gammaproteobacteria bacterium]